MWPVCTAGWLSLRLEKMMLFGIVLMCAFFLEVNSLKCYQCRVDDNRICTNLEECPKDQAYDRCMTTIQKSEQDGFYIFKKCALAPCELRDPKQKSGLGLEQCDRSKPEYMCVDCCKEDGCNKDGAFTIHPSFTWTMTAQFILAVILCRVSRHAFFL